MSQSLSVVVSIDGGARGNPGPAGAGVVIVDAADGQEIFRGGYYLGRATNNVAEYNGLVKGLETAAMLGAGHVEAISDSELLVRQMNGQYRVKNAGLKPLYEQAKTLAAKFESFSIRHVRREQNTVADGLVNDAIDAKQNVENAVAE